MRLSRDDIADLLLEKARACRLRGIFSLNRQSRRFYFSLSIKLVQAAKSIVDGTAELLAGPVPDACLDVRCIRYTSTGLNCPHESREEIREAEGSS
jgi:hypothetical protein